MKTMVRVLVAAAFLLAAPAASAGPERDYNEPPPGCSADDAKLWRELRHATTGALWQLARVAQSSARIGYGKYYEGLDEAIRLAPARAAADAKALRERLVAAAAQAQQAIPKDGGRVHPCRVTLLDLEQRIDPRNVEVAGERAAARDEARRCADRMSRLISAVTPAADALEGALRDVDVYLKRSAPAAPPGEAALTPPPGN